MIENESSRTYRTGWSWAWRKPGVVFSQSQAYRAPVHPAPPRVCVVVRWSCVLQSTQSAEEPRAASFRYHDRDLEADKGGKVVRVGRQSMQEMDELENEEIHMFISLYR